MGPTGLLLLLWSCLAPNRLFTEDVLESRYQLIRAAAAGGVKLLLLLLSVASPAQVAAVAIVCLHVARHVPIAVFQRTWTGGFRAACAQWLCQVRTVGSAWLSAQRAPCTLGLHVTLMLGVSIGLHLAGCAVVNFILEVSVALLVAGCAGATCC